MVLPKSIALRGGRQHNLQSVDVDIPIGCLTVVCGVSGSGKTSLALETLFAEGQRRYIESFSAYARRFLARIEKPQFDSLENLPPSIALTRNARSRNNRSTLGTVSETIEPLRSVFSQVATPFCFECHRKIERSTPESITRFIESLPPGRALIGFEFAWNDSNELSEWLFDLQTSGFIRLVCDDQMIELSMDRSLMAELLLNSNSAIAVVDRIQVNEQLDVTRVQESIEAAFQNSPADIVVLVEVGTVVDSSSHSSATTQVRKIREAEFVVHRFSDKLKCNYCDIEIPESESRIFNFNSPVGACETCQGFGETPFIDLSKVVPDRTKSLREGAIQPWRTPAYEHELQELAELAGGFEIPLDVPVSDLTESQWSIVQHGVEARNFGGLDGFFRWLERKKYKMHVSAFLSRFKSYQTCSSCNGSRLKRSSLAYQWNGKNFAQICAMNIDELQQLCRSSTSSEAVREGRDPNEFEIAFEQLEGRLAYLQFVGIDYLSLDRMLHTLSGGEAQRAVLTTLLGSDLVDMLYVLDEPTVGLHPADTIRVGEAIERLVARGNTVVMIEHEPHLVHRASHVLEVGPGAGIEGGRIVFSGTPQRLLESGSLTGRYLSQEIASTRKNRKPTDRKIELVGATGRNLKNIDVSVPLGCLSVVVGVSGSGKSSLILDTLCPAIQQAMQEVDMNPLPFRSIRGSMQLRACMVMDQSTSKKSIRSSPATLTKAMDEIRLIFAQTEDAKERGFNESYFSFNGPRGRCPVCEGTGFNIIDMQFLADVRLPCSECNGKRFRNEVLEVKYRDQTLAEILDLSIDRAIGFFRGHKKLQERLQPLVDIGLSYLPLGQPVSDLSAGESTRLKLATHLKKGSGQLFVLDEPTTGLHYADVDRLLSCLDVLLENGNSVLVIEHNTQFIRAADYIIELGPGPGPEGGSIIATGNVEEIQANPSSRIREFL